MTQLEPAAGGLPVPAVPTGDNDAAARRLAEHRERLLSDDRLELALDAGQLGDWSWDPSTDVVTLGPRAARMFGLPEGRTTTWTAMRELLHPEDRERAAAAVLASLNERTDYDIAYRVCKASGEEVWIASRGRATYADDGSLVGMVGAVQDITARKRVEEALREERRVLELLNKTGAQLASQLDTQAILQMVTDSATELSGAQFGAFFYNVTDESGDAFMLFTLSGAPRAAFEKFGHPRATPLFGPTFRGEGIIRSDDIMQDPRYGQWPPHHGKPRGHLPVRSYLAVPVISRTGEVFGGLFFGHEKPGVFTERAERLITGVAAQASIAIDNARLYEAARQAAESERAARAEAERLSAAKDEFLATLSHELRTPLSAILGWSQILKLGKRDNIDHAIDVIERNARTQTRLIEDLLDVSRITSGKVRLDVQSVPASSFVEAAVESLRPAANAKGVQLELQLDPSVGAVSGDPARLQQVVWNLVSNAVKFTPHDGKVQVRVARANAYVEITVADTGAGIEPEFLPYVFERFRQADASTTRRHGGLGLGLSIVRSLVELHGGTVHVDSPGRGQGATFNVRLPLTVVQPFAAPAKAEQPRAEQEGPALDLSELNLSGVRVLVVDDEPDARDLVARALADCKAEVFTAGSAREALERFVQVNPNVLVSDIGMPELDGYDLLRELRTRHPDAVANMSAIALTAFARSEDRARALRAGFGVHLTKPIEPAKLVATVASVARRRG